MIQTQNRDKRNLGNTSKISPSKKWAFTFFDYTDDDITKLINILEPVSDGFIFGEETCPTTNKKHLQGYVEFIKNTIPFSLKLNIGIHWGKKHKKSTTDDNITYCSKEGKYWYKKFKPKIPLELITMEMLYDWQLNIIDILKKKPDNRTIHWYWEPNGKSGKLNSLNT